MNPSAHIGVPSGRAGHGIVLSLDLPVLSALPTMPMPGNPRRARSGHVVEAYRQAVARPISAVILPPFPIMTVLIGRR